MAMLAIRSEFTENASAKASSGWNACMSKPMCKFVFPFRFLHIAFPTSPLTKFPKPDIPPSSASSSPSSPLSHSSIALSAASPASAATASPADATTAAAKRVASNLNSSPYAAYQHQQQPPPPPGYAEQQQQQLPLYAHFDASSGRARTAGGGDALPAMPVWNTGQEKRVYEGAGDVKTAGRDDVEMGKLEKEPMLPTSGTHQQQQQQHDPVPMYAEMDAGNSSSSGDFGQRNGYAAYKPFAQSYRPYSANAWGRGQGQGQVEKEWRDV
ncbi:MAG: hypothetical protein Q9181_000900 [Wetmoreana brouardii]